MIYIDKFAQINRLTNSHPIEKTLFALITLGIVIISNSMSVSISVFCLLTVLVIFYAKIPPIFYSRLMMIPGYFIFAAIFSIIITTTTENDTVILNLHFFKFLFGITQESLHKGVTLFFKSISAISCMYFLVLTVPFSDTLNLMRKIKLPELFLELAYMIYRFLFVMLETTDRIHISQISRLSERNFKSRFRSVVKLGTSLFFISMKRYEDQYNALESRLYSGKMVYLEKKHRFSFLNITGIILIDSTLLYFGFLSDLIVLNFN